MFPVLNGKMLNVNVMRMLGGSLSIYCVDSRLAVHPEWSGTRMSEADVLQDGTEALAVLHRL